MKKIIAKWLLIPLGLGMVPVILLGASQGGIALSPIIIVFCLCIGLIGASVHSLIYSFSKGSKSQRIVSSIFSSLAVIFISLQFYADSVCAYSEEQAFSKIRNHTVNFRELDIKYLGKPVFSKDDCTYSFMYESPYKKYEFLFTKYGEVHSWDFEAHKL